MTNLATPIVKNPLPVLSYTSAGWEVIGHAATLNGAERIVRKAVHVVPGFTLSVWQRSELIRQINGGPEGWVFAMGK